MSSRHLPDLLHRTGIHMPEERSSASHAARKRTSDPGNGRVTRLSGHGCDRSDGKEAGLSLASLKVDGGACANDFLMQFQADLLNAKVERPKCIETTALELPYLGRYRSRLLEKQRRNPKNLGTGAYLLPKQEENWRKEVRKGWKKPFPVPEGWARDQHPSKDL